MEYNAKNINVKYFTINPQILMNLIKTLSPDNKKPKNTHNI